MPWYVLLLGDQNALLFVGENQNFCNGPELGKYDIVEDSKITNT